MLCNRSIRWILEHDRQKIIKVAALNSEFAQNYIRDADPGKQDVDSVILGYQDQIYDRSDAVLKALSLLPSPWCHLYHLRWFPKVLRDGIYDFIARHRYRIFGKYDTCPMPSKDLKDRYIF